jgi:hypothetical protein
MDIDALLEHFPSISAAIEISEIPMALAHVSLLEQLVRVSNDVRSIVSDFSDWLLSLIADFFGCEDLRQGLLDVFSVLIFHTPGLVLSKCQWVIDVQLENLSSEPSFDDSRRILTFLLNLCLSLDSGLLSVVFTPDRLRLFYQAFMDVRAGETRGHFLLLGLLFMVAETTTFHWPALEEYCLAISEDETEATYDIDIVTGFLAGQSF